MNRHTSEKALPEEDKIKTRNTAGGGWCLFAWQMLCLLMCLLKSFMKCGMRVFECGMYEKIQNNLSLELKVLPLSMYVHYVTTRHFISYCSWNSTCVHLLIYFKILKCIKYYLFIYRRSWEVNVMLSSSWWKKNS